jgi:superfamily II DNA or RNA helicase
MDKPKLIGCAIDAWKKHGDDRQTILFAPTVELSKKLAEKFNEQGVTAEHLDADTPDIERDQIRKRYLAKETRVLCNVGILGTGVDLPITSCIILYRPTKSINLYVQQCGRGTRPCDEKKDFIILDHAGNVDEHGFITDPFPASLDPAPKRAKSAEMPIKTCPSCYAVVHAAVKVCPECNEEFPETARQSAKLVEGSLHEIKTSLPPWVRQGHRWREKAQSKNYKRGWVWHQMKVKYGEQTANLYMKKYM